MRTTLVILALAALVGCAGGGSAPPQAQPPTVTWERPSYTVTIPNGSTDSFQVHTTVTVTAGTEPLPPIVGLSITPTGADKPVTAGNGPWQAPANIGGVSIPVTLTVQPTGSGSYATGPHQLTASFNFGPGTYTGTATLQVNQ